MIQTNSNNCPDLLIQARSRYLRVALGILGNAADAEDAIQDAVVSALVAIDDFRGSSSLSTWMYRIVVNECLMALRRKQRRGRVLHRLGASTGSTIRCTAPSTDGDAAHRIVERREIIEQVSRSLESLDPAYQTILAVRDIHGISTRGSATHLGHTSGAVRVRLHRARTALRRSVLDAVPDNLDN